MVHGSAFDMGKSAARNGRAIEVCPFLKGDSRYDQWIDGYLD